MKFGIVRSGPSDGRDTGKAFRLLRLSDPDSMRNGSHNPLVPGSSPGGPTISIGGNHHLMASRAGDRNPLV